MGRLRGWAFGAGCALWFALLPLSLVVAVQGPVAFTWPLALGLAPMAAIIARRKGRGRLAWSLLALPPLWILATLVVSSLLRAP